MPSPMDPPSLSLSPQEAAILTNTYGDPFSLLRSSPYACHWIFTISHYVPPRPVSLSQSFRLLYMCAAANCTNCIGAATSNPVVQKSSTLLLPVQSQDGIIAGFFVETGDTPCSGRYVFFPSSAQLFKASKPRPSDMQALHFTRISQVASGMYIIDNTLASFAWSDVTTEVPAQHVVHSRGLTFCKLVRHLATDDPKNNFLGLGDYGIFDCASVTGEGYGAPAHSANCRRLQSVIVGTLPEETAALRAEFERVFGSVDAEDFSVVAGSPPAPSPPLMNSAPLPSAVMGGVPSAPIPTAPIPLPIAGPPQHLPPAGNLASNINNVQVTNLSPRLPISSPAAPILPPISSAPFPMQTASTTTAPASTTISIPSVPIPPSVQIQPSPTPSSPGVASARLSSASLPMPAAPLVTNTETKPAVPKFKKTLAAPTKSEIVIRNRISAQRSNEKRRRKIEATKTELAYLKTTYLPQLELRKGTLISENQSLRLRFMEKYQQSDFDSFF